MRNFRTVALGLLLSLWATAACAQSYPTNWRWIVGDTNPTTQVWNGATSAMEANTIADYQNWVGGLCPQLGGGPCYSPYATQITGSANNGSGLCRMTVTNAFFLTSSGNTKAVVNGTGTVCDGTWSTTLIDNQHVDLVGSSFSGASATTGILGQGTPVATMARLSGFINDYNNGLWASGAFLGQNTQSSGGNVTLTNPLLSAQNLLSSSNKVILPQMNLFGSVPIGTPVYFYNSGNTASSYVLYYSDGSTQVDGTSIKGGGLAKTYGYILIDNSTANGTLKLISIANGIATFDPGAVSGAIKSDGSGTFGQAACASLTNGTTNCSAAVGQLPGTATNDNAAAGKVGEYVSSFLAVGSAVSVSNNTATNITYVDLTAGDWDVWGNVATHPVGGSTQSLIVSYISSTSATLPSMPIGAYQQQNFINAPQDQVIGTGPTRFSLSTTTRVYVQTFIIFAIGTMQAYGTIEARRAR